MPLEVLARGGGVALLLLLALMSARGRGAQRLFAAVYVCGAAFLLVSSPAARAFAPFHQGLVAVAGMGPFLFLIAIRRTFGAAPTLSNGQVLAIALACGALAVVPSIIVGAVGRWLAIASDGLVLSLFAATSVSMLVGIGDDLDAQRRSVRYAVSAAGGALGVAIAAIALIDRTGALFQDVRGLASLVTPVICLILIGAYCASALKLKDEQPRRADKPAAIASKLTAQILQAFDVDRVYRDPALTLSTLARRLQVPEHQLRAAINADLGCRNFSTFVNGYRLKDVVTALQDPAQNETSISTIALDAGFGSIASFNRVFKAETGRTPNEFRLNAART